MNQQHVTYLEVLVPIPHYSHFLEDRSNQPHKKSFFEVLFHLLQRSIQKECQLRLLGFGKLEDSEVQVI